MKYEICYLFTTTIIYSLMKLNVNMHVLTTSIMFSLMKYEIKYFFTTTII